MKPISVGARTIGPSSPCLVVAEIGINHNGDSGLAREMISAAAEAGADCVKFQNYVTEDFLSDRSLTIDYVSQGRNVTEPQWDLFKRCEIDREWLSSAKECCDRSGVIFQSTPTGESSLRDLIEIGCPLLKNGSDFLVHLPLIAAMARTGLPTVLSTGMATLAEIDDAVRAFRDAGGKDLVVLHCTSSYPTPPEHVNLRKLPSLASAFECLVGFSDHTFGTAAALGAVAFGACLVEKHFTLDKNLPGPDHRFSADPPELRALVEAIRALEQNLGVAAIGPTEAEERGRRDYRLSCVAACDLPAGHRITAKDVAFRRPAAGLPPKALDWFVGLALKRGVPSGKPFEPGDFA